MQGFPKRACLLAAGLGAILIPAPTTPGVHTPPELVSTDAAGTPGDADAYEGGHTPNGRYVVFYTLATNLGTASSSNDFQVVLVDRRKGTRTLVSAGAEGEAGNGSSWDPCISANGRWILYASNADNLAGPDGDSTFDLFLYDARRRETRILPWNAAGEQADGESSFYGNAMTPNGRWIVFNSTATNLVAGNGGGLNQVYVQDLRRGTLTLVSADPDGLPGNGASDIASLSPNGRFVVFRSTATNLVPGDTNGTGDIFLRDLRAGTTTRVSVDSSGAEGNSSPLYSAVSSSGRLVAFSSWATNLVPGDENGKIDVFLRDLDAGTTTRISEAPDGTGGDGYSWECALTANGRTACFYTSATNLVPSQPSALGGIYLYDVGSGTLTQADRAPDGSAPDGSGYVWAWSMTPSGKYLLFSSSATQFTTEDTGGHYQMYLKRIR